MNELLLEGCTPEPLMGYLKALGVLRLVSEQKDATARGRWSGGSFGLTTRLTRDELLAFFRDEYKPTPLLAPWGGRSGFYPGSPESAARAAIKAIEGSTEPRLALFRNGIACVRRVLSQLNFAEKPEGPNKLRLMRACRAEFPDSLLPWLDSVYALTKDGTAFPPLLGTGGNEGSGSFVSTFAQSVVLAVLERDFDEALECALFGSTQSRAFGKGSPGHFSPEDLRGVNPWDYVLALEGCCLWAAGIARRTSDTRNSDVASFPYTVHPIAAGATGLCASDEQKPKGAKREVAELWLPLWSAPTSSAEIQALLAEGRVSNGKRAASTALDFAVAASTLGVDRGISAFQRMTFQMRNGKNFYATSLGTITVREQPNAFLIDEVRSWVNELRRANRNKGTPARFGTALRRIDAAIFEFCKFGGEVRLATILAALGAAERELAIGSAPPDKRRVRRPLGGLSSEWLSAADDGSAEFRLARGLAFLNGGAKGLARVRRYLEPVERTGTIWKWSERGGHVVWGSGSLARNLGAVLARRLMDAEKNAEVPETLGSRFPVPLADVAAFLGNETDDAKLEELLWGLSLVDEPKERPATAREVAALPRTYALLKLTLLPDKVRWAEINDRRELRPSRGDESGVAVRTDAAVLAKLRAGDVNGACEVAVRRLRATGFVPVGTTHTRASEIDWQTGAPPAERLLAALLFPVPASAPRHFAELVLRIPTDPH